MATNVITTANTTTLLEPTESTKEKHPQTPTLRLSSSKPDKAIKWAEGTIDNEGMGKKSSKCCCVYKKPRVFGESSSEDEDSADEDKCKGPKNYHKKSKKDEKHHEDCNC